MCSHIMPRRMRWNRKKPLFLAPSYSKALWEHVFRGFIGGTILFYPVWHKTAPEAAKEAVPNRAYVIFNLKNILLVKKMKDYFTYIDRWHLKCPISTCHVNSNHLQVFL